MGFHSDSCVTAIDSQFGVDHGLGKSRSPPTDGLVSLSADGDALAHMR